MIKDSLWQPLVFVGPNDHGFIIHPGSKLRPQLLQSGNWYWHWPLLTILRVISGQEFTLAFREGGSSDSDYAADDHVEPIICLSRDYRLFKLEGMLTISLTLDSLATDSSLVGLNRRRFDRLVQSALRQAIRQVISLKSFRQLSGTSLLLLQHEAAKELQHLLRPQDLRVDQLTISAMSPYTHLTKV